MSGKNLSGKNLREKFKGFLGLASKKKLKTGKAQNLLAKTND